MKIIKPDGVTFACGGSLQGNSFRFIVNCVYQQYGDA